MRPTVIVVSHTHWDREWYQPFEVFRLRLCDQLVRLGLFRLQLRAHILAHVHIRNVNREDFKRRVAVERLVQNGLGNAVRILEHVLVTGR